MKEELRVVRLSDDGKEVIILNQTKLPNTIEYLHLKEREEMYNAIKRLEVRGAPAIGVFSAYAISCLASYYEYSDYESFFKKYKEDSEYLNSSRPTAVNLSWALNRMMEVVFDSKDDFNNIKENLYNEAIKIDKENIEINKQIALNGLKVIEDGDGILTICNAGKLACLGYGTATAPMYLAHEMGLNIKVYSCETRPLLQGARLTSFELYNSGIDVTSICDNMASIVMKEGKIHSVMVGCDRIAANGDFANKIGTSGLAILAKHYGIPFYCLGPSSTLDLNTPTGDDIVIEVRNPEEIASMWYKEPMILEGVKKYNPSFDVTDHNLVTAFITEKGIILPPFKENFIKLFGSSDNKDKVL